MYIGLKKAFDLLERRELHLEYGFVEETGGVCHLLAGHVSHLQEEANLAFPLLARIVTN